MLNLFTSYRNSALNKSHARQEEKSGGVKVSWGSWRGGDIGENKWLSLCYNLVLKGCSRKPVEMSDVTGVVDKWRYMVEKFSVWQCGQDGGELVNWD